MERVVVTGMGTVNPLGLDVEESWKNALAGLSGVGPITLFDASRLPVHAACEVKGFHPEDSMEPREVRRRDRFEQFAVAAAKQAALQSGYDVQSNALRTAVVVSSATGGLTTLQNGIQVMGAQGPRHISPFLIPMFMPNGASGLVAIDLGAKGPCLSVASACASGADGIGLAWSLIRQGEVDGALAGGSDATLCELGVAAFDRVGAVSRRDPAQGTPQPFDKERDGLVMGEGAGVLLLESLTHARRRGAPILAELVGYAATGDAYHVTAPAEDGAGGAEAIRRALASGGLSAAEVDYVNAHGTGTPLNDASETRALKAALGGEAARIPVSSTKSMTGHMMGATGALEAIFCVQAIRSGMIPPTINYRTPDPECDLDYVPNQARRCSVRVAVSNAFGFGGHNAVLVFKDFTD
jgi:beta-ketoacyl-acyl-carrier-protein synthase II